MNVVYPDEVRSFVEDHPHRLVFASLSGAHLYGFPSADSDWDIRGTHVLPLEDVIGLDEPERTFEMMQNTDKIELDLVTYDLSKFLKLLLKRNGNVLEQIVSDLVLRTSPAHEELRDMASRSVTRHHAHHYRGLARSRWRLLDTAEEPRLKPLLYAYRAILTGTHLMRTGMCEPNLMNLLEGPIRMPEVARLVEAKRCGIEKEPLDPKLLEEHRLGFEQLFEELDQAAESSQLPDDPQTRDEIDQFLRRIRLETGLAATSS